jgi:hypothetical protein
MRFNGRLWALAILALLFTLFIIKFLDHQNLADSACLCPSEMGHPALELIQMRFAFDMPYLRLAVILGMVAGFSLFAVFWLQNLKIKAFYEGEDREA